MSCHQLLHDMLQLAVRDIQREPSTFRQKVERESARRWILGLNGPIISFTLCCDALNIEPDAARDALSGQKLLIWRPVRRKRRGRMWNKSEAA